MGASRQTGKETNRDFNMVTLDALPEPSIPPLFLYAPLLSSTRLVGSLSGLVLCLGGRLSLSLGLWSV